MTSNGHGGGGLAVAKRESEGVSQSGAQRRPPAKVRRREILDAAAKAFADRGYRGTSLGDIAQAVGVSAPALIHHFPSKDALLLATLEARDRAAEVRLAAARLDDHRSFIERTSALCRWNAENLAEIRLFVITRAECLDPEHPVYQFFRRRYQRIRDQVTRWIEADQRAGLISEDLDASRAATQLLAVMRGLEIQWALDQSLDMCSILDSHLRLLEPHAPAAGLPSAVEQEESEAR